MDDWSPHGPGIRIDRHATDWGLLSLGLGGCFLVMAPVQLVFNSFYWSIGRFHADRQEFAIARVVGPLLGLAFLSLIGFGLFAGFRGLGLARKAGQPVALPLGGVLACGLDVVLWLGLTLNLMGILGLIQ